MQITEKIAWRWRDWRFTRAGLFAVKVNSPMVGFFAQLSGLMIVLRICHRRGLTPYVLLTSKSYVDSSRGLSFLNYFFEGPEYTSSQQRIIERVPVREVSEFPWVKGWSQCDYPPVAESLDLFSRYYRVKREILREVDAFEAANLMPGRTLGLHYRGTDKWTESTYLSFQDCAKWIQVCLNAYPKISCVFVSTDSQPFLDFVVEQFPSLTIRSNSDHIRSTDKSAVHLSSAGDPYQKGREALVNCLLLARCDVLLKSVSNLSGWAKVFNPSLPVYLMNHHTDSSLGFPEREMIERGWFVDSLKSPEDSLCDC